MIKLNNENKLIPEIEKETVMVYNDKISVSQGTYYIHNFKLHISLESQLLSDVFVFTNPKVNCKLYYVNGNLYILDNYIKLKKFDILLTEFNTNILVFLIININDNKIYYKNLTTFNYKFEDNTFINFILPYQPFDIYYININYVYVFV